MATKTETAAERVVRLKKETERLQAEIAEAEQAAAVEEAGESLAAVLRAVKAGEAGEVSDWVAVLGLVPDEAIRAAGLVVKAGGRSSVSTGSVTRTRAPNLKLDAVIAALPSGKFTVAGLAEAVDREPNTARNFVPKLIEAGAIKEVGVDDSAPGPRKPKLYSKTPGKS